MRQMDLFNENQPLPVAPVSRSAIISDCGKYRYALSRTWNDYLPKVMFLMLNPSTADGESDDPTIRRCIGFAKAWGFGGLYVCNLFAYRATKPEELLLAANPFGDENIWHTRQLVDKVSMVVCAWGNEPIIRKLLKNTSPYELIDFAKGKLHYLKLSSAGTPWHPLYLPRDVTPTHFG